MKKTKIISAFPACGKTYVFENFNDKVILDSDSSKFSWVMVANQKVRNPDFPQNYIRYIKENIGKVDYILVSTHENVRRALEDAEIDFYLVYPDRNLKKEWIGRCFLRGNRENFCWLIADNWDNWIDQLEQDSKRHKSIILRHGEHLSNVIRFLDDEDYCKYLQTR